MQDEFVSGRQKPAAKATRVGRKTAPAGAEGNPASTPQPITAGQPVDQADDPGGKLNETVS